MGRSLKLYSIPLVLALAIPVPALATTVEVLTTVGVTRGDTWSTANPNMDSDYINTNALSASFASEVDQAGSTRSGGVFSNSAEYNASVNAASGQLRFSLEGAYLENCGTQGCGAGYSVSALTRVFETLTVSGTGTLTAVMQVDGLWDAPRYNFTANLSLSSSRQRANDQVSFTSEVPGMGAAGVDTLLSAEISFVDAQNLSVNAQWRMQGDISATASRDGVSDMGFMDASNTATFFVFASEGLSFAPSDSGFLSNPAYLDGDTPAPIPLPASLPLLLAGLGAFGVMRGKKSSA